jgi:hypothetical protein
MIMKCAWPPLALLLPTCLLGACTTAPKPQPIPVLAEAHQCPGFPLPPPALFKPPAKTQLPASDALTATEQAIQLDELIKWVRAQAAVDNNPKAVASHPDD